MEFGTAATELFLLLLPFHSSFSRGFLLASVFLCRKHFVIVPPPLRERWKERRYSPAASVRNIARCNGQKNANIKGAPPSSQCNFVTR